MIMMHKEVWKQAFVKAIPITGSYLFVSMAYGLMMQEAGFNWLWSLGTSLTVYTGAFQFVLVTFLSSGASVLTIAMTALLMNSRQFFYGLTFVEDYKKMGKRYPYMVHTLTDETYAVDCSMLPTEAETPQQQKKRQDIMFFVALFSRISWMAGAVLGGILGQVLPVQLEGIDFCMTALFVTIFIDQWRQADSHIPALLGIGIGIVVLFVAGADYFLLPTLLLLCAFLLLMRGRIEAKKTEDAAREEERADE